MSGDGQYFHGKIKKIPEVLLFNIRKNYGRKRAMRFHQRKKTEINSSSMADIAFLLLIFFLVTTTIQTNKGLSATLPPHTDEPEKIRHNERNLYKVHVNSKDQILVEGQPFKGFDQLHTDVREFVLNYGKDPSLSDDPEAAIISLQMNRGTHYKRFIEVMDVLQGVYYEIYGEKVGLTAAQYRNLNLKIDEERNMHYNGREGIPMNISIAEPHKIN